MKTTRLFAALAFVMLMATSCTKYTIDSENFMVAQFKLGDELLGCTKGEATDILQRHGWRFLKSDQKWGDNYYTKSYQDFSATICFNSNEEYRDGKVLWVTIENEGSPNSSVCDKKTHNTFLKMFNKDTYTFACGNVCYFYGFRAFSSEASEDALDFRTDSFDDFKKHIGDATKSSGYSLAYVGHGKSEEDEASFSIISNLEEGSVSMELSTVLN